MSHVISIHKDSQDHPAVPLPEVDRPVEHVKDHERHGKEYSGDAIDLADTVHPDRRVRHPSTAVGGTAQQTLDELVAAVVTHSVDIVSRPSQVPARRPDHRVWVTV